MAFGILDTRYIDLPANIDNAYITGFRNRAGMDFAQALTETDSRLRADNTTIDPLSASIISRTEEIYADASGPSAFVVEERSEYALPRPQLAEGGAHMLPLRGYDVSLGFTEDGLEAMSLSRLLTQIDSAILGMRQNRVRQVLTRLFSDAEVRVAPRTVNTSPGFAGSGTGDNAFPRTTYPDGTNLPGGYTHYFRVSAAGLAAGLKVARDRLKKWHAGPYDLIASQAEIDAIALINPGNAADGFVSAGSALVRQGGNVAEAQVDATMYLGVLFGDVRVHMALTNFSDANIAIYKSYGALNPRNPLRWRVDPLKGPDATLRSRSLYPLDQAVIRQDYGIGVGDRTAVVLIFVAPSGDYTPPTIA